MLFLTSITFKYEEFIPKRHEITFFTDKRLISSEKISTKIVSLCDKIFQKKKISQHVEVIASLLPHQRFPLNWCLLSVQEAQSPESRPLAGAGSSVAPVPTKAIVPGIEIHAA